MFAYNRIDVLSSLATLLFLPRLWVIKYIYGNLDVTQQFKAIC